MSTKANNQPDRSPCTFLGVPSCVRFCQQELGEFPRLVGRYLLPKQARETPQILVDKTSPMTGRLRVYNDLKETFFLVLPAPIDRARHGTFGSKVRIVVQQRQVVLL